MLSALQRFHFSKIRNKNGFAKFLTKKSVVDNEKSDKPLWICRFGTPNRIILEQLYGRSGEDMGIESFYTRPNYTTFAISFY